jgi:hypothetical protein
MAAFLVVAIAGVCLLALDVPQGEPDAVVLASWPVSFGPFITLLGLNRLGASPLIWILIALLGVHVAAGIVTGPRAGRWAQLALPAAVAGLALAGLVASGFRDATVEERDPRALRVEARDAAGEEQRVEAGSAYEIPGLSGTRKAVFDSLTTGPFAAERDAAGGVRAYLPAPDSRPGPFRVAARPALLREPVPAGSPVFDAFLRILSIVAVAASGWSLLAAAAAGVAGGRKTALVVLILGTAVFLVNPFAGPGRGVFAIVDPESGTAVSWLVRVRSAGDLAPWTASVGVPATFSAPLAASLAAFASALWTAVVIAFVRRADADDSQPPGLAVRVSARIAAGLLLATGVILLGFTLGRLPLPETPVALVDRFSSEILPRIPVQVAVLDVTLSSDGPWVLAPATALWGVGLVAAGLSLLRLVSFRPAGRDGVLGATRAAAAFLLVAACGRAAAVAVGGGVTTALPVSLVGAALAAAPFVVERAHPGWASGRNGAIMVAAFFQFLL